MPEHRNLNSKGSTIADKVEFGLGCLLLFVMIIYAAVRGQHIASQLPAQFRTTNAPNKIPIDFINQLFPSKIPSASYEFPALTLCPEIGSLTGIISCYVTQVPSGIKVPCHDKGSFSRNIIHNGLNLECQTVNGWKEGALIAKNAEEELTITATLQGTIPGSPSGVFVTVHPQQGKDEVPAKHHENFFVASTGAMTEVMAKKVYQIDEFNNANYMFEVKPSTMTFAKANDSSIAPYLILEIKYPKLEITYEKAFFSLDMNNWLGEVGGLGFLLLMLLRVTMMGVRMALKRSDKFAYTDMGKDFEQTESFGHF